jgi:hypothetical protein
MVADIRRTEMSYQTYQTELARLKVYDAVQASRELNNEIDSLTKILFTGPEINDESYMKVIVCLLNKVKSYQLNQLDNTRTMTSSVERKGALLGMQQRRLGEVKTSYAQIIDILNKIIANQCSQ